MLPTMARRCPGEHVVDPVLHLVLLIEEAAGGVGDRHVVVADLEDHHAADAEGDALVRDTVDLQLGFTQVERKAPHLLDSRQDEHTLAGDDLEPQALTHAVGRVVLAEPADDQGLVGLGDPPHEAEDEADEYHCPSDDPDDDHGGPPSLVPYIGVTTTVRGGKYSTTTTRVPILRVSPPSLQYAWNASLPPRTVTITSPRCPGSTVPVTRPILPTIC
jgi:hypothetical protein